MKSARRDRERLLALLAVEAHIPPHEARLLPMSQIAEITRLIRSKYQD